MDPILIRQATPSDFQALSELIALHNQHPETHCIHSDTGDSAQSLCNEMRRLETNGELCFVLSFSDGLMTGAMGCELDVELGRGWLRGPFIINESEAWSEKAAALYKGLLERLPASIRQLDTYLNLENQRGNDFYRRQGFAQLRLVHVYVCQPPEAPFLETTLCAPLNPREVPRFVALHEIIFPGTYATGKRIVEKIDDQHQVYVSLQDDDLIGYCCANIDEDTGDGSLDFLGVREDARGKGIGRLLLQTALNWMFEVKKVPQVILVVHDEQAFARSLYESTGFRLKYTGVHNRKVSI